MRSLSPTEAQEQEALFERAELDYRTRDMFAIPNEGKRSVWEGARFKARGLKRGVPDIFLPVPSGKWHGMYIEMKRKKPRGKLTSEQLDWLLRLTAKDYFCAVCYGWEEAWNWIEGYLAGKV